MNLSSWLRLAIVAAMLALVGVVHAKESRVPRVALFFLNEGECGAVEIREGLRELGYREGRNIEIQCHHASGNFSGGPAVMQAIVRTKPDVIVARGHSMVEVAMAAERSIPIVGIASGDPVAAGWAKTLARPGGNFTGVTYFALELYAKRLEYLKALIPNLKRVGLLTQSSLSRSLTETYIRVSREAAGKLGIKVVLYDANDQAGIERAYEAMARDKIPAVMVLGYSLFFEETQLVASMATMHGVPTMHFLHGFPTMGGLIGYGPDYLALQRRLALYIDKILRGAKPGDIPIEQPRDFKLSINLGVAHDLGLKVPQSIIVRADRVIE
jgi:putative ABC transport system substrate-binding protein